uniref:U9-Hexatoxin-Hc1f_1 n=1 Tax=Hadronyche cerberea TaxID=1107879 RepID=A0A4V2H9Q3_HADCE
MNFSVVAAALLVVLTVNFIDSQETSSSPPSPPLGRWPWGPKPPRHCRPHHGGFFEILNCDKFFRDIKMEMDELRNNSTESCKTLSTWENKKMQVRTTYDCSRQRCTSR